MFIFKMYKSLFLYSRKADFSRIFQSDICMYYTLLYCIKKVYIYNKEINSVIK